MTDLKNFLDGNDFTVEGLNGLRECIRDSIGNEYGYVCPTCGDYFWSGNADLYFSCDKCGRELIRINIDD